ncbi:MAG: hypothetical protein AAF299_19155 [Pseudomonadota bacterium]
MRNILFLIVMACAISLPFVLQLSPDEGSIVATDETPASTWVTERNPSGDVPASGFKAMYFSRADPDKLVFEETVPDIAIQYSRSELKGIESAGFMGYWVGRLNFDTPTTRQISVSESHAKSVIRINGKTVYESKKQKKDFTHSFAAGEHFIEVEHDNYWHTVGYKVTIQEKIRYLTEGEVKSYLVNSNQRSTQLYYVGLYDSSAQDATVEVELPETDRPIVLWLNSHSPIDWKLPADQKVSTVILGSRVTGSRVYGNAIKRVLHTKAHIGVSNKSITCTCSGIGKPHFHCEYKRDLTDAAKRLLALTGSRLDGYAVTYDADRVKITAYDETVEAEIFAQQRLNEKAKRQCLSGTN